METLRAYLKALTPRKRARFAKRCGTTAGYLRKATFVHCRLGGELAIAIDRESRGMVRAEDLRPDIDWKYLRRKLKVSCKRCAASARAPAPSLPPPPVVAVDSSPSDATAS